MAESYIGPSPRNPYTGALSDALAKAKSFGNQYEIKDWVPLLGGTGLGDLFLGGSPELLDDVSYQGHRGLVKGGNEATGGIGTYTLDPRVADAAMVGADMYGVGKLGTYGAKKVVGKAKETLTERLLKEELNNSRRAFLKSGAKGATIAAAGAGGVAAARKFGKEAAPKVVDNAAVTATKKYKFDSISDYMKDVDRRALEYNKEYDNAYRAIDWDKHIGPEPYHPEEMLYLKRKGILDEDAALYQEAKDLGGIEYQSKINEFSPKAKEQMKAYKQEADIRGANWTDYWWEGQ